MAICACAGRNYSGNARQYMETNQRMSVRQEARQSQLRCHEDGCQPESLAADLPLAMAYVNPQPYTGLVCAETALSRGSSFNNLYDPWAPACHC